MSPTDQSSGCSAPADWRSQVGIEISDRDLPIKMRVSYMRCRLQPGTKYLPLRRSYQRPGLLTLIPSVLLVLFRIPHSSS